MVILLLACCGGVSTQKGFKSLAVQQGYIRITPAGPRIEARNGNWVGIIGMLWWYEGVL